MLWNNKIWGYIFAQTLYEMATQHSELPIGGAPRPYNEILVNEVLDYVSAVVKIKEICLYPNELARCTEVQKMLYSLLDGITKHKPRARVNNVKGDAIKIAFGNLIVCMNPKSRQKAMGIIKQYFGDTES